MKIAYLVHNLGDPAVSKRVAMLRAGGAQVALIGFHRDETFSPPRDVEVISLGRTHDARFVQRVARVIGAVLRTGRLDRGLDGANVILARNLEMLCVAHAARRRAPGASVAYECLDVHRLMLSDGKVGQALRWLERRLMEKVSLLIVSSPAFIDRYFEPRQKLGVALPTPWRLLENKVFAPLAGDGASADPRPASGRPWKIGWFGAIRCRRSLDILCDLAVRRPDLIEVVIRGRPSYTEFDDFDAQTRGRAALRFEGAYSPDALPALYGGVHFTWAIDTFEAGANSDWLLPNRLYEGGLYGAVPLALEGVETGAWLKRHGLGLLLEDAAQVEAALEAMTPERYAQLAARAASAPAFWFAASLQDCQNLVAALAATPEGGLDEIEQSGRSGLGAVEIAS